MSTTLPSFTCTFKPKPFQTQKTPPKPKPKPTIPPTDRVIDFGKHKGKMLGTLPSSYLKWVSNNLRAGDTEPWARLADQVLQDPVYQDRVEWEFAQSAMSGVKKSVLSSSGNNTVDELVEISEIFGWDNEDKLGWGEVEFELLGTTKTSRIPRLSSNSFSSKNVRNESDASADGVVITKMPLESNSSCEGGDKRSERRERMRQRRVGEVKEGKMEISKGGLDEEMDRRDRTVEINSRFPGRESLLKKVLHSRNNRRFS